MSRGRAVIENARVVVPLHATVAQKNRATGVALQCTTHRGEAYRGSESQESRSRKCIREVLRGYGSSTLSITWMTPLLWYTFAIVTLAVLPFASVTVTSLPAVLKVSVPPCTVA